MNKRNVCFATITVKQYLLFNYDLMIISLKVIFESLINFNYVKVCPSFCKLLSCLISYQTLNASSVVCRNY